MSRSTNPYAPPLEPSAAIRSDGAGASSSLVWFIGPALVGYFVSLLFSRHSPPIQWSLGFLWVPLLLAAFQTFATSIVYVVASVVVTRRSPATRLSRLAAAVVFVGVVILVAIFCTKIGFRPPGLLTLPTGALAATVADRLLANRARRRRRVGETAALPETLN